MQRSMIRGVLQNDENMTNSLAHAMGAEFQFVTSNLYSNMERAIEFYRSSDGSKKWPPHLADFRVDCMVVGVLSWAHVKEERCHKQEKLRDEPFNEQRGHKDWDVRISGYALSLENRHLWIPECDGDAHSPVLVTIRPMSTRNERKRTPEGLLRRAKRAQHSQQTRDRDHPRQQQPWRSGSSQWRSEEPQYRPWGNQRYQQQEDDQDSASADYRTTASADYRTTASAGHSWNQWRNDWWQDRDRWSSSGSSSSSASQWWES